MENNGINEKQISIDGVGLRPVFEPPFFGKDHKECEYSLTALWVINWSSFSRFLYEKNSS